MLYLLFHKRRKVNRTVLTYISWHRVYYRRCIYNLYRYICVYDMTTSRLYLGSITSHYWIQLYKLAYLWFYLYDKWHSHYWKYSLILKYYNQLPTFKPLSGNVGNIPGENVIFLYWALEFVYLYGVIVRHPGYTITYFTCVSFINSLFVSGFAVAVVGYLTVPVGYDVLLTISP